MDSPQQGDNTHVLQVMLQRWSVQYHTTQGMNSRIGALLAFAGVALGFLLKSEAFERKNFLAIVAAGVLLLAILFLLISAVTRWSNRLPPVAAFLDEGPEFAAREVEKLVATNQVELQKKGKWLDRGLWTTFAGLGLFALSVVWTTCL